MRRAVLILLTFIVTCSGDAQSMLYSASMHEALLKRNNKVYYIKTLTNSITTPGGLIVYANGKIKDPVGNIYLMADGDCLKFKGTLLVCYVWIKNDDGVKFKQRLVRVWSILNKPVTLQNGICAMPDGTLKLPSGNSVKMKDKAFVAVDENGVMAMQ